MGHNLRPATGNTTHFEVDRCALSVCKPGHAQPATECRPPTEA